MELKEIEGTKVIEKKKLPLRAVIIKITGNNCNLRCGYCFYHNKNQQGFSIIDEEILEKLIKEYICYSPRKVYFIWHGGEPLMAGLSFFSKIIEIENKYRKKQQIIKNAIQTNGTLLNEKWAIFLKINHFKVGVSLDGSEKTHNLFRRDMHGNGTFLKVIQGIKILRKNGIEPGFISVLTKPGLSYLTEDFEFLIKNLHIRSWGINVYHNDKKNSSPKTYEAISINNEDFIKYFKALTDLWLAYNNSKLSIREIDGFGAAIFNKTANLCSFNGSCGDFICVDIDGKVYPCDRFTNDNDFVLGNLNNQSLQSILESETFIRFRKFAKELPLMCEQCRWQKSCNNGCAAMRDKSNHYYYCLGRQKIFEYLEKKIKKIYYNGGDRSGENTSREKDKINR